MIQIDDLILRVPGWDEEPSKSLGKDIAKKLSENLPSISDSMRIPDFKIQMNAGSDANQMATRIADQIIRQIKLATL